MTAMILRLAMLWFCLCAGTAMVRADVPSSIPSTRCAGDINVCLALDGSGASLTTPDWNNIVDFAQELIQALDVATNGAGGYSALRFASRSRLISDVTSASTLITDLESVFFTEGFTNHHDALADCQNTLIDLDKAGIIILLTDGMPTIKPDSITNDPLCGAVCRDHVISVADDIKANGTRIQPVFIEPNPSSIETTYMEDLSSDGSVPGNLTFGSLSGAVEELVDGLIECKTTRPSKEPSQTPSSISSQPSSFPSDGPSLSKEPSLSPSKNPSVSTNPSSQPSKNPSSSDWPTSQPSSEPSPHPSTNPSLSGKYYVDYPLDGNLFKCAKDCNPAFGLPCKGTPPDKSGFPTAFFDTAEECCRGKVWWVDEGTCVSDTNGGIPNPPLGSMDWYINWDIDFGTCAQDCVGPKPCGGLKANWNPAYKSADNCCESISWKIKKDCSL